MTPLTRTSALALFLTGAVSLSAQTAAPAPKATAPVHHATTATSTTATAAHKPATVASACATDLPTLSPKLPALPSDAPCAKPLFTFTTSPSIRLSYVSPLVTPEIRQGLGLDPTSFSLSYSDVKAGTGPLALPHKYYTVNYTGYLTDGSKFDSSLDPGKTPFTFPIGAHRVIPGWDLGMQGMHIGGKRRLYIPWQLAYGDKGQPPSIPSRSNLVFDIELISQSDTDPNAKPAPAKPATSTPPATPPADKPETAAPPQ